MKKTYTKRIEKFVEQEQNHCRNLYIKKIWTRFKVSILITAKDICAAGVIYKEKNEMESREITTNMKIMKKSAQQRIKVKRHDVDSKNVNMGRTLV